MEILQLIFDNMGKAALLILSIGLAIGIAKKKKQWQLNKIKI